MIRPCLFRVLVVLTLFHSGVLSSAHDEPVTREQRELLLKVDGKWKLVAMTSLGTEIPEERLRGLTAEFQGDQLIQWYEGEPEPRSVVTIKLDPGARPPSIDFTADHGNGPVSWQGIFEIEDGRLKVCFKPPGAGRPKSFRSDAESRTTLLIHEREKP